MRIGILSDTHLPNVIRHLDELGPEPAEFFATVDLILHGGDLTSPMVLDWLEQFAPVACTIGNNDPIVDTRCREVRSLTFTAGVWGWCTVSSVAFGLSRNCNNYFPPRLTS